MVEKKLGDDEVPDGFTWDECGGGGITFALACINNDIQYHMQFFVHTDF
jgi:hypothetical protein